MAWPELPEVEAEFDAPISTGEDCYEVGFRSRQSDGTPTTGRIIGLAGIEPPTIIFEEEPTDQSGPKVVRKFNHGTPENVRSLIRIKGQPERFLREIRANWKRLLKDEIEDEPK